MELCMKDLLLGIDIGTSGTKCSFYDFQGRAVSSAYTEYPMIQPHPLWAEQDPNKWWDAVCTNLLKCFHGNKLSADRVAAIGVSCTNAVTLVDREGNALCNAIGLHDQRSVDQLEKLRSIIDPALVLQKTGNVLEKGSFALPRLKWLQDCRQDIFPQAYKFLTPGGFIIQKLTGQFVINHSRANLTLLADIETGEWDMEIAELTRFPAELLPETFPACSVVGGVTRKAAELTGLKEGTPVTAGAVDTVQATLAAGAVNPGDVAITIGSSGRICCISKTPVCDQKKKLINCESPLPGLYTIIQTTNNAGVSLRWFRDQFGQGLTNSGSNTESAYAQLDRKAAMEKPGAGGVIFLPYLSGEQSPIWNAKARGMFYNIGLESTYGSFVRAILEGVAFSIRDCLECVKPYIPEPEFIPLGGGVANSDLWCQIFADVLGYPMVKLNQPETETLGDALTAAAGIGITDLTLDYGKTIAKHSKLFLPNEKLKSLYDDQFHKYKEIYVSTMEF